METLLRCVFSKKVASPPPFVSKSGVSSTFCLKKRRLLHLFRSAGVDLTLDDFKRIAATTPFIADLKPSGKYVMEDLHTVGGTPGLLKYMLKEGYLHGDCLTITGKTMAENLAELPELTAGQDVIGTFEKPVKPTGHIAILNGNLAPEGAVGKITGKEGTRFEGPAAVFDCEEDMIAAVQENPFLPYVAHPFSPYLRIEFFFLAGKPRPAEG